MEASAKILSQSSDAKVVFDGIATRISAKNKKVIDKSAVKYLKDLGFTEVQARYALRLKRLVLVWSIILELVKKINVSRSDKKTTNKLCFTGLVCPSLLDSEEMSYKSMFSIS